MKKISTGILISVLLGTQAGCGGGGDSSESERPNADQSDALGYEERPASISHEEGLQPVYDVKNSVDSAMSSVVDYFESLSERSDDTSGPVECLNDGGLASLVSSGSGEDYDVRWVLENCEQPTEVGGVLRLSGELHFVEEEEDIDEKDSTRGYLTANLYGGFVESNIPFALKGRADFTWLDDFAGFTVTDIEISGGGDSYYAIPYAELSLRPLGEGTTVSASGRVVSYQLNGYLDLSTPIPLHFMDSDCPVEGALRFDGDGYAEVRYGVSTGTGEPMVEEVNGSRWEGSQSCMIPLPFWDLFE